MSFYTVGRNVCHFLMNFILKIEITGQENIPVGKGFVLASNHRSFYDPVLLGIKCKPQLFFMAKAELFEHKIFGYLIKKVGAFPVSRGKGDNSAIENAINIVKSDRVLAIFPEGTRSKDGKLLRGKSGAIVIAAKTKSDIVPAAISFTKRKWLRTVARVKYGKPITFEELGVYSDSPSEIKGGSRLLMGKIGELLDSIS
ncbi:MAG: lysophospholipid acyltransferase family protein [Oscillospiraceae bacterium]